MTVQVLGIRFTKRYPYCVIARCGETAVPFRENRYGIFIFILLQYGTCVYRHGIVSIFNIVSTSIGETERRSRTCQQRQLGRTYKRCTATSKKYGLGHWLWVYLSKINCLDNIRRQISMCTMIILY